jgi:hypothetical protein
LLFQDAVEEARAWWQHKASDMPAAEALAGSLTRLDLAIPAARVDDCVGRFACAELEGKRLGRYGPLKFFPALGELAGTKLATLDDDERWRVLAAVEKGVGIGYVSLASMEQPTGKDQGHAPREIWNVWVPGLNAGLAQSTAMPPDVLRIVRREGGSAFQADALDLGLGGFRKTRRLEAIGAFYAQAGVVLRALQVHPERLQPDPANLWPYEEHSPPRRVS